VVNLVCSFFGIEKGAAGKLEPISAREWGRRQAAASPVWSEEKWKRIGLILGVEFVADEDNAPRTESDPVQPDSPLGEAA